MNAHLSRFLREYLGVVLMALVPVVLTTFVSLPFRLASTIDESQAAGTQTYWHMT